MPWYANKGIIRDYLKTLNKDKKILGYTLFQPGGFTDYLGFPHKVGKYLHLMQTQIDFGSCRAIVLEGSENEARITLTTAADLADVVVKAVEYESEWPVIGGIKGDELTIGEIICA